MRVVRSRQEADCALVALTNLCDIDYDAVKKARLEWWKENGYKQTWGGTPVSFIREFLEKQGFTIEEERYGNPRMIKSALYELVRKKGRRDWETVFADKRVLFHQTGHCFACDGLNIYNPGKRPLIDHVKTYVKYL